jgi:hypothetical protein
MKNIEIGLEELVEYYPTITAEYSLGFDTKTIRLFEVTGSGKYQTEISDLAFMFEVLDNALMLKEHADFYYPRILLPKNKENIEFVSLVINEGGKFPYDMFNRVIVIPAYYEGKYYKIILDVAKALED